MPSIAQSLQQAVQFHQSGRLADAEQIYRSVIRIDPKQPDALHLLGVALQQRGNAKAAADYIGRAVALNPQASVFHANLAAAHKSLGELQEAKNCLEEAVRLDPEFTDAHYNLGTVLKDLDIPDEAANALQRALQLNPAHADAHNNLGIVHAAGGRWNEAVACYRAAVRLRPEHAEAWNNLGLALSMTVDRKEAPACFERAVQLRPDYVQARVNLGNWYREEGDPVAAERVYRDALPWQPHDTTVHNNLGISLKEQGRFHDSLACFSRVLEFDPEHVEAHVNRGFLHGLFGDLPKCWEDSEWRFRAAPPSREFTRPRWQGEPLAGRTLLVHVEQGIGDQVMYASCLPDVAASAGRCLLECDPRLADLFRRSFTGVEVIAESDATPAVPHDVQIPAGSLPMFVRPSLDSFPDRASCLVPDEERVRLWQERFGRLAGRITVGISWRGGSNSALRRQRSIPLEHWHPLLSLPGVNFVTLQYGGYQDERRQAEQMLGVALHDWDDADPWSDLDGFAAQIAALDLVISVDNSTVHFAGGLGIPCWVLLPFVPDWRWMLDRDDSPWYSSLRLFRQPQPGDWNGLLQMVSGELREMTGSPAPANERSAEPAPRKPFAVQEENGSLSADDHSWLQQNATLRWHPEAETLSQERGEFHLRRYEFAAEFCRGKHVLDVACGTGYGSSILSQVAESVSGIDICPDAVDFAARKYGDRIRFQRSFAEHTPFDDAAFDAIVCFEALEHLISARAAMREFVRLLTADGVAVVSVPNNWGFTPHHFSNPDLPFLETLCSEFFAECEYFYNNSGDSPSQTGPGIGPLVGTNLDEAECLIAVCRRPRPLRPSSDRVASLLDEIYTAAFEKHSRFLKLCTRASDAWPTEAPRNIPTVTAGRPLTLQLDTAVELSRVLLRLETDILECTGDSATIAIPDVALAKPRPVQLQLMTPGDKTVASLMLQLASTPRRA
jgi:tetratricopeptide (TPR) repeat protein/SAM-dependent methyltransferase